MRSGGFASSRLPAWRFADVAPRYCEACRQRLAALELVVEKQGLVNNKGESFEFGEKRMEVCKPCSKVVRFVLDRVGLTFKIEWPKR